MEQKTRAASTDESGADELIDGVSTLEETHIEQSESQNVTGSEEISESPATAQTDEDEDDDVSPTPPDEPAVLENSRDELGDVDDASEVGSEAEEAKAAGAIDRRGYCWLSLLPNELRRAARRRYPPCLNHRLVGVLRDKLGPDTQLAYTVAHFDIFHYYHVRPGVGTTLAELYLLMDHNSFVGIDVSMAGEDLVVEDLQGGASPSGSGDELRRGR
ncbi:hypothetical protein BDZ89DRAFT_1137319 [Hymenopellis radicata]|nr:hypothetical protein BDZ89DRAFT_1137319 [Hymenopellis radicata]